MKFYGHCCNNTNRNHSNTPKVEQIVQNTTYIQMSATHIWTITTQNTKIWIYELNVHTFSTCKILQHIWQQLCHTIATDTKHIHTHYTILSKRIQTIHTSKKQQIHIHTIEIIKMHITQQTSTHNRFQSYYECILHQHKYTHINKYMLTTYYAHNITHNRRAQTHI